MATKPKHSELERVKADRDRLRRALDKAARILHSDALRQQHEIAALHGFAYRGEMFTKTEYEQAIDGNFPAEIPPGGILPAGEPIPCGTGSSVVVVENV